MADRPSHNGYLRHHCTAVLVSYHFLEKPSDKNVASRSESGTNRGAGKTVNKAGSPGSASGAMDESNNNSGRG